MGYADLHTSYHEPFSRRGKALGLAIGLLLIFPAHITFVPITIRVAF